MPEKPYKFPDGSRFRHYTIIKKLGEGSFGAVYGVTNIETNEECAMKVESVNATDSTDSMIKMEVAVLKTFRNSLWPHPHICDYVDSGMTPSIRYVVMKLCGPNLADVLKHSPRGRFSESTTIRLGIQAIRSIEALHRIGFVHRDIKPPNYAIGLGQARRTVFLLDYGLARQYIDRKGHLRPPRSEVGFRGTMLYASLNTHLRKDLGRQDDLWSLLYMLVELQKGKLPWRKSKSQEEIAQAKRLTVADKLFEGMAPEFHVFHNELHGLQFRDTPDYDFFCRQLRSVMERQTYADDDPFDWEKRGSRYRRLLRRRIENQPFKTQKREEKKAKKERGREEKSLLSSKG